MRRRRLLRGVGVGALAAIAGCSSSDGGDGGTGDGADDTTTTTTTERTETTTDDGTDTTTTTTTTERTETTTDDGTDTTTTTTTTEQTETTATSASIPPLEDHLSVETNHRVHIELDDYAGQGASATIDGVWVGSDYSYDVSSGGRSVRYVSVDGELSVVAEGQCIPSGQVPGTEFDAEGWADVDEEAGDEAFGDPQPLRTVTIDGERAFVYEVDAPGRGGRVEVFLSAETGYPRRMVGDGIRVEYSDWGAVSEAIESPC